MAQMALLICDTGISGPSGEGPPASMVAGRFAAGDLLAAVGLRARVGLVLPPPMSAPAMLALEALPRAGDPGIANEGKPKWLGDCRVTWEANSFGTRR